MTLSTADLQAALHGVRALLLDLDGVIILKGLPVRGSVDAIGRSRSGAFRTGS